MEDEALLPNEDDSESEETSIESQGESGEEREETFDCALPTTHSYLGDDMNELSGRTLLEWEREIDLDILPLPGVVLIPGETLPLYLYQAHHVTMVKRCIEGNRTFGVCCLFRHAPDEEGHVTTLSNVGTTAEVFSVKEDTTAGIDTITVKATGRQRFSILSRRRQVDGNVVARARIKSEHVISGPPQSAFALPPSLLKPVAVAITTQKQRVMEKMRSNPPSMGQFPLWVYKLYDCNIISDKVKASLKSWNDKMNVDHVSLDPIAFSFWIAANLPLDDALRVELLTIDSVIYRLQRELTIIRKYAAFCCEHCEAPIGHKDDLFSMSLDGPLASYVNPGGYVHQTITLYKVIHTRAVSHPTTENSWFPGYAWSIVQCSQCASHLGWKFARARRDLRPAKFYGITRSAIKPAIVDTSGDDESTRNRGSTCRQS